MTDPEFLQILQQGVEGDECVAEQNIADPEHLQILQQGVEAWNAWRGAEQGYQAGPQRGRPPRG